MLHLSLEKGRGKIVYEVLRPENRSSQKLFYFCFFVFVFFFSHNTTIRLPKPFKTCHLCLYSTQNSNIQFIGRLCTKYVFNMEWVLWGASAADEKSLSILLINMSQRILVQCIDAYVFRRLILWAKFLHHCWSWAQHYTMQWNWR